MVLTRAPGAAPAFVPAIALAGALVVALVGGPIHGPTEVRAQVPTSPGESYRIPGMDRPFRHADHQRVTCGDCHRADDRHRATRRWTARDCAACHHGDAASLVGCTSCHARTTFAAPLWTATPMTLSVWEGTRHRDVMFEHERHAAVGCLDCHRGGMGLPPESCAVCHTDHHRPEAQCAHCHRAPDPAVHDLAAHATCTGAGCHAAEVTTRPMLSRQFCLVCHDVQRHHRAGRVCVDCHVKPAHRPPPATTTGTEPTDHGDL
jgi:hypothetical protein